MEEEKHADEAAAAAEPPTKKPAKPRFKWSDIDAHVLEEDDAVDSEDEPLEGERLFDGKIIGSIYEAIGEGNISFVICRKLAMAMGIEMNDPKIFRISLDSQEFCTFDELWEPLRRCVKAREPGENMASTMQCPWKGGVEDFYLSLEGRKMILCALENR